MTTAVADRPTSAEIRPGVARVLLGVVHDLITRALREEIGDSDVLLALRSDCQRLVGNDEALVVEIRSLVERTARLVDPEVSDLETPDQLFDALQPIESWVKAAGARDA